MPSVLPPYTTLQSYFWVVTIDFTTLTLTISTWLFWHGYHFLCLQAPILSFAVLFLQV